MSLKITAIIFALSFNLLSDLNGQGLPVGTPLLEDYYRRSQLTGHVDSTLSFMIRPLLSTTLLKTANIFDPDSTLKTTSWTKPQHSYNSTNPQSHWTILPFTLQTQYNSHHPYGWNDGAMVPAKGYQMLISGGVYGNYGSLSIRFQPEVVYARNNEFDQFPTEHFDAAWVNYYRFYNNIDQPERFGEKTYQKAFWGQSSIRLNFDPVSIGYSTENLWWGPGIRNSLLMSNTAPGIRHFTLNTTHPVKTKIGSFEGQLIAGRLDSSGFTPPEPNRTFRGVRLYNPKQKDWRYMSGLLVTYQPKWVPGLFLGLGRTVQIYHTDQKGLGDYLPLFTPFKSFKADRPLEARDQLGSAFLRWVLEESRSELYFEYGRKNHSTTLSEFATNPEPSRAYIFGLQKLVPLKKRTDEYIRVGLELTQLQQSDKKSIVNADSWYINSLVRHGYTHKGEVLGAGVGPGGNLQSLNVAWIKGLKQVGLQLERYVHNNDFYYYTFGDIRIHWVDVSASAIANWDYKNLLLNMQVGLIRSLNYQWWYREYGREDYYAPGRDVISFRGNLGATYRF